MDTGASDCFVSQELRNTLSPDAVYDVVSGGGQMVRVGNKNQCPIQETIKLRCSLDGIVIYYHFHVMKTLAHPLILGRNLLHDLKAEITAETRKVRVFQGNPVSVRRGLCLKSRQEQIVAVEPWESLKANEGDTVTLEPSGLTIAAVEYALNYANGNWWLKVANLTDEMIFLDRNDVIAYVNGVNVPPLDMRAVRRMLNLDKWSSDHSESWSSDGGIELNDLNIGNPEPEPESTPEPDPETKTRDSFARVTKREEDHEPGPGHHLHESRRANEV